MARAAPRPVTGSWVASFLIGHAFAALLPQTSAIFIGLTTDLSPVASACILVFTLHVPLTLAVLHFTDAFAMEKSLAAAFDRRDSFVQRRLPACSNAHLFLSNFLAIVGTIVIAVFAYHARRSEFLRTVPLPPDLTLQTDCLAPGHKVDDNLNRYTTTLYCLAPLIPSGQASGCTWGAGAGAADSYVASCHGEAPKDSSDCNAAWLAYNASASGRLGDTTTIEFCFDQWRVANEGGGSNVSYAAVRRWIESSAGDLRAALPIHAGEVTFVEVFSSEAEARADNAMWMRVIGILLGGMNGSLALLVGGFLCMLGLARRTAQGAAMDVAGAAVQA